MKLLYLSLLSSVLGLVLVYNTVPQGYPQKTVERAVLDCTGNAQVTGIVERSFLSRKGNNIAVISGESSSIMAVLNNRAGEGKITVRGRLSKYNEECWIFEG